MTFDIKDFVNRARFRYNHEEGGIEAELDGVIYDIKPDEDHVHIVLVGSREDGSIVGKLTMRNRVFVPVEES